MCRISSSFFPQSSIDGSINGLPNFYIYQSLVPAIAGDYPIWGFCSMHLDSPSIDVGSFSIDSRHAKDHFYGRIWPKNVWFGHGLFYHSHLPLQCVETGPKVKPSQNR